MNVICRYVCFAILAVITVQAQSFQQFAPSNEGFKTGPGPSDIAAGDFNNDGNLDFVTADSTGAQISVFLNQGNAIFLDHGSAVYSAGQGPVALAVGDFNNDGVQDIAVADSGTFNSSTNQWDGAGVSVLYGNGDGTFAPAVFIAIPGGSPNSITLTDYNGDVYPDLAVTSQGSSDIAVLENNQGAGFTIAKRFVPAPGLAPGSITSADFNQDGTVDLAFVTQQWRINPGFTGDGLYIAYNQGDGNYTINRLMTIVSPGPINAVALNNDKFPDLLVQRALPAGANPHGVLAMTNDQKGGFTQQVVQVADNAFSGSKAFAYDVNGDGMPDVLTSFDGDGTNGGHWFNAAVALGNADGTFEPFQYYGGPNAGIVVGDFNNDRGYDFIGINSASEGFFVYLNTGQESNCAAFSIAESFALCSPGSTNVSSPVRFVASPNMPSGVDHIEVWDNGQKIDQVYGNHLDKSYPFSNGQHTVSLVAGEQTRLVFEKLNTTLQVQTPGGGGACPASPNGNTVLICEPAANSSVSSPVHVTATATGGSFPIVHMRVYIDTNPEFDTDLSTIDTSINLGAGQHFIVVVAWNSNGDAFISGPNRNFTVTNSTGGPCGSPATDKTINICSPLSGSTQNSPVQVSARARWDCCVVSHMRVYVDDVDKFDVDNPFNNDISPSLQLSSGSHNMVIIAWDNQGDFIESAVQFTVP